MQHDASRMVQAVLQFGDGEERLETVRELCCSNDDGNKEQSSGGGGGGGAVNNLAELCKIQYAHFVVLKMIKYCARDEECVRLIVKVRHKKIITDTLLFLLLICLSWCGIRSERTSHV